MTHVKKKTLKKGSEKEYVCVCIVYIYIYIYAHIKLKHFAVYPKHCKSTIRQFKNQFMHSLLKSLP